MTYNEPLLFESGLSRIVKRASGPYGLGFRRDSAEISLEPMIGIKDGQTRNRFRNDSRK